MARERRTGDEELDAINRILWSLGALEPMACQRVLSYVNARVVAGTLPVAEPAERADTEAEEAAPMLFSRREQTHADAASAS